MVIPANEHEALLHKLSSII